VLINYGAFVLPTDILMVQYCSCVLLIFFFKKFSALSQFITVVWCINDTSLSIQYYDRALNALATECSKKWCF